MKNTLILVLVCLAYVSVVRSFVPDYLTVDQSQTDMEHDTAIIAKNVISNKRAIAELDIKFQNQSKINSELNKKIKELQDSESKFQKQLTVNSILLSHFYG